ncbi:hypothetical protein [Luedemannella helvata]|uniref:Glycosyltransferase RgtA/B/C/D-like domain-containing protein n=1 Tax=Luedemannella helvata TaxID=349315 RepID=A0ABN2JQG3_9ACTN
MTERNRWLLSWLAVAPAAAASSAKLVDSDPWWQIRTGQLIWDTGQLPATDPFSWTITGRPWVLNSWGFDVLLAGAHHVAGMAGAALLGAVWAWIALGAMLLLARSWGAPPAPAVIVLLAGSVLYTSWFSSRPQLADYAAVPLLLVLVGLVLNRTRSLRQRVGGLVGVLMLQVAWVNLHAAATLGIAIVCLLCAGDAVRAWRESSSPPLPWYVAVTVVSTVGALVNPYGFGVLTQAAKVREASLLIREWSPASVTHWQDMTFLALAILAMVVAVRRRWWGPSFVIAALAIAGVTMIRFLPVAGATVLPMLAAAVRLPAVAAIAERRRHWVTAVAVVAVTLTLAPAAVGLSRPGRSQYGADLVAALPSGCKLFNSYVLGGPLILDRPDVPVSLDSRSDLYGEEFITELGAMTADDLVDRGVTCILLRDTDARVPALRTDPRWRLAGEEESFALFLRTPA